MLYATLKTFIIIGFKEGVMLYTKIFEFELYKYLIEIFIMKIYNRQNYKVTNKHFRCNTYDTTGALFAWLINIKNLSITN